MRLNTAPIGVAQLGVGTQVRSDDCQSARRKGQSTVRQHERELVVAELLLIR